MRLAIGLAACVALFPTGLFAAGEDALAQRLRKDVEIVRDKWGVPHIYGKTDAATVFGLMFAQAEDNFWQLEEDYLNALGRASELRGARGLMGDLEFRLLETERLSKEEYAAMTPEMRALCDAAAAGVNWWIAQHPSAPRLLRRWEPWHVLAFQATGFSPLGFARMGIRRAEVRAAFPELPDELFRAADAPAAPTEGEGEEGSNMWAVSAKKSASGHPLLFINPHVGFFGGGQRYEAHLASKQGLDVSGFAILGTPYIRTGFTGRHGWSHTNNNVVVRAVFEEKPAQGGYRFGGETRAFTEWTDSIRVLIDGQVKEFPLQLRKTHHGPVFAMRNGNPVTVWVPNHGNRGLWEQRWGMAKARSLAEFKQALETRAIVGSNTMYADRAGNIFYIHGNAIPRRDARFDWTTLLDGSDPAADPKGYHELSELPQVTNPASGFLQNCNSTPFQVAGESSPEATKFPAYVAPELDNFRARNSRRLLTAREKFTYEQWGVAATDTRVFAADENLPRWLDAVKDTTFGPRETEALQVLREWDHVSRVDSVPMTVFFAWNLETGADRAAALKKALDGLEKDWGTWRVPWGEVNRLQRVDSAGTLELFDDAKPSLPVAGARSDLGIIFAFGATQPPGRKRMYGRMGNTYVAVLEFGPKVRSRSVVTFGQTNDPGSKHFFDQAVLYAKGQFKEAWYRKGEVKKNAERRYRP
jgi:penicillin amidase